MLECVDREASNNLQGVSYRRALGAVRIADHFSDRDELRGHGEEGFFDVLCVLGAGFQERDSQAIGEGLGGFVRDDAVLADIALVADQELARAFARVPVHFIEPVVDMIE